MKLKMKYHYSYFIYPYVVKENNYNKYVQRLLKNQKCRPQYFKREKNLSLYNFFLPTVRDYMFKTFGMATNNKEFNTELELKIRDNAFKSSPCAMFEYDIGLDAQAKTEGEDGIFFKIQKIEIICFKTGICFLAIKTDIEDSERFSDLLNFNVKFRDINTEVLGANSFNNIKIQSSTFGDVRRLSEIIREITGSIEDAKKIDMDINRFLTYSYVCLDQENWNEYKPFSEIEKEFFKFANVLNSEFNSNFENERLKIADLGKYIKIGISRAGMNLITSSINTVNYTSLPVEFENEYLYTYIYTLYKKFYFAKVINDFSSHIKGAKAKKEFVDFTNDIWVHELTNNDNGILIEKNIREVLDLRKLYNIAKEQYDVTYKNFKMKNSDMLNKVILILLAASVITNIVNFINLYKLK